MLNKKLIIITSIIFFIAILLIILLYYFFFQKTEIKTTPSPTGTTEPINNTGPAKPAQTIIGEKLFNLSLEPVISPILSPDGTKIRYYSKDTGNVYETDFEGKNSAQISSVLIKNLLKIIWSQDRNKVISILSDPEQGIKKVFYDYEAKKAVVLNKNIQSVTFAPDGKKIAYQYIDDSQNISNISLSNPDGGDWQTIFPNRIRDLKINFIGQKKLSLSTPASGLIESSLLTLDYENSDNPKLDKIISSQFGLSAIWSPDHKKVLYSSTQKNGKNISLNLVDIQTLSQRKLPYATLAEKCAFSENSKNIYCAVPKEIPIETILPDDYYKGKLDLSDSIWKSEVEEDKDVLVIENTELIRNFDIANIFLSPKEDYLFFTDKKTELPYSIKL